MNNNKITVNNTQLAAIPGNLVLKPNTSDFGPFKDRSYTEGSVYSRKGKHLGYYCRTRFNNGSQVLIAVILS